MFLFIIRKKFLFFNYFIKYFQTTSSDNTDKILFHLNSFPLKYLSFEANSFSPFCDMLEEITIKSFSLKVLSEFKTISSSIFVSLEINFAEIHLILGLFKASKITFSFSET